MPEGGPPGVGPERPRTGLLRARRAGPAVGLLARIGLVLALLGAACAVNPQSGERQVILMSEEAEQRADEEGARQVEAQIGLVDDPELAAYVDALGQELASHALRRGIDYVFNVVDMDEPNAFALPGGHIYVSRGLLLLANSEAELANVLGHEIGHVAARHAAARDARGKLITLSTILGAVAAAAAGQSEVAVAGGQFLALGGVQQAMAAYSRDQEREADRIGQDLAVQAGIDPRGMASFLDALDDYTRLRLGSSRLPSWFDTHPATPERVAETVTRAEVSRWTPDFSIARTRAEYLARIDGLSVGRPASEGVVREDGRFVHPDLRFAVRFPPGWDVQNEHSRVLAAPPSRDALVMLELQGPGDDPRAAAAAAARRFDLRFSEAAPVKLGELEAFRARTMLETPQGRSAAEVTWLAYRGQIYRLTGAAPASRFGRFQGSFRSFPRSFRPLEPDELGQVEEVRARIAAAREGESLAAFGARVGNEWGPNTTALVNGLTLDARLEEGQLLKYARREPYVPQQPGASPAGRPAPAPSAGLAPRSGLPRR